jgi:drug/metabolite transporter (DMT)-like permease
VSRRGALLFVAVGIIWGIPYFLIRISVRELSPSFLVLSRTVPASLVLLPFAIRQGGWAQVLRRWRAVVGYTIAEFAIPWLMLFRAEQHLPSSLSGLLIATVPVLALVLMKLTGSHQPIGAARMIGIVVGFSGVAVLVGFDVHTGEFAAVGEIAITAVGYAAGPIIISRFLVGLPNVVVVTTSLLLGSIIYAPFALTNTPHHVSGETIEAVAGLAFGCTAIGFLAFFALIAEVGPARATVITYVNPAVAVLLGVLALHERFTAGIAVGFPLVLLGSYLSTRGDTRVKTTIQPSGGATAPRVPT